LITIVCFALLCCAWFEQYGWSAGLFGEADTLSRAKGSNVEAIKNTGLLVSGGGSVRLCKWEDYPDHWKDPQTVKIWQALHTIIKTLNQQGQTAAGVLLATINDKSESIRQLAYYLYTLCERKNWAEEARAYNELITSWHHIVSAADDAGYAGSQVDLYD
jgi:putative DNA methylase